MNCIFQIIKTDFLDKVRKHSFLTLILGIIFVAININNHNLILMYSNFSSDFNSGSLSSTISVIFNILFLLAGFYLLRGSVQKDRNTKMGDIIASTCIRKSEYVFGKWIGNVITLQFIVLIMYLFSIFLQIIQGTKEVNLIENAIPFLIISIPAMLVVASISLLFDIIPILKNVFGSILYFFIWIFYLGTSISGISMGDLSGLRSFWENFGNSIRQVHPEIQYSTSFMFMYEGKSTPFAWDGVQLMHSYLFERFLVSAAIILFCLSVSIALFDRFSEHAKKYKPKIRKIYSDIPRNINEQNKIIPVRLNKDSIGFHVISNFSSTFRIFFRMIPLWLWLIEAFLGFYLFAVESESLKSILISVILLLPLFFWTKASMFQNTFGMKDLFLCTLTSGVKQFLLILAAGIFLTLFMYIGPIAYFLYCNNYMTALHIIVGSVFSFSLALGFGTIMNSTKIFELCYLFIWYYGIMENSMPQFDFIALSQTSIVYQYPYLYIMLSVVLVGVSIIYLRSVHYKDKV